MARVHMNMGNVYWALATGFALMDKK